jgi:hypothetical protein
MSESILERCDRIAAAYVSMEEEPPRSSDTLSIQAFEMPLSCLITAKITVALSRVRYADLARSQCFCG